MTISIAHVNVAKGYRGGERQTELLIRELNQFDYRQALVARKGGALSRRFDDIDVEIRAGSGTPFFVTRACRGMDILHVHEGRSIYGAYLCLVCNGTPYVVTRRVNNPLSDHWLAHKVYRRAASIAAVAPQVAEVVKEFDLTLNPHVIHSSSSGLVVNKDRSHAIRASHPGKCLVGHVGALDNQQKGQEFILDVARQLQESHPDIHFLLVGGGRDEQMLKKTAAGLRNLTFTGFVENVGDYLAAFDMFILPSSKEGIGSVLLDAMEQKLPVVASRVGGVPEIVHDASNGILIDPARPDQLKAAILRLHDAPELRREMGEQGQLLAKSFTADVMCKKYMQLYRSALELT